MGGSQSSNKGLGISTATSNPKSTSFKRSNSIPHHQSVQREYDERAVQPVSYVRDARNPSFQRGGGYPPPPLQYQNYPQQQPYMPSIHHNPHQGLHQHSQRQNRPAFHQMGSPASYGSQSPPNPYSPANMQVQYSPNEQAEKKRDANGRYPKGTCDKCDGPHLTDSCPIYKKKRDDHPDAWRNFGRKTPLGMGKDGGNFKLKGATVRRQPGDGSCLFHSLAVSGWGGGIEMAAFSHLKRVNVHVYEKTLFGSFKRISCFDVPEARKTVHVLYCGGVHYDALIPP